MVDRWLNSGFSSTPRDLAAFRILFAAIALRDFWNRSLWTIGLPADFWAPPLGVARIFGGPPSAELIVALHVATATALAALLVGALTPLASIASAVLMIAVNSIFYSYGKIDHDILFVVTPLALAFSGWGSVWSVDSFRQSPFVRTQGLNVLAVCIGLGFLAAGLPKLNWLRFDSQETIGWAVYFRESFGQLNTATDLLLALPSWAAELFDWATVLLECGLIVTVIDQRLFRLGLCVAALFHFGVLLTFDIEFARQVVVYAAFFPLVVAARRWYLWLPASAGLTLLLCDWSDWRAFGTELIVVCGAVLLPSLVVSTQLSRSQRDADLLDAATARG